MKKIFFSLLLSFFLFFPSFIHAQQGNVSVSANVSGIGFTLSGMASPFASIVLSSEKAILKSLQADNNGVFTFSNILLQKGFSQFCLDITDVNSYGKSNVCLSVSPLQADYALSQVFLPPTLGLSKNNIGKSETTTIRGYSLPQAHIIVTLNDKETLTIEANSSGYFEVKVGNLRPGTYTIKARATYNNQESLESNLIPVLTVGSAAVSEKKKNLSELLTTELQKTIQDLIAGRKKDFSVVVFIVCIVLIAIAIVILRSKTAKKGIGTFFKGIHNFLFTRE